MIDQILNNIRSTILQPLCPKNSLVRRRPDEYALGVLTHGCTDAASVADVISEGICGPRIDGAGQLLASGVGCVLRDLVYLREEGIEDEAFAPRETAFAAAVAVDAAYAAGREIGDGHGCDAGDG